MRRVQTTLRLPSELLAWLDAEAKRAGTTRTKLIETLLTAARTPAEPAPAPDGRAAEHARKEGLVAGLLTTRSDLELAVLAGPKGAIRDAAIFELRRDADGALSEPVQRALPRLVEAEMARRQSTTGPVQTSKGT